MPRSKETMKGHRTRLDLDRLGPERLETIGRVLDQIWDLPEGEAEQALGRLCGEDAVLRAEILDLLAADREAGLEEGARHLVCRAPRRR